MIFIMTLILNGEMVWSLPSAVSIMLERLCPRLIPRTTALEGRSTRGPLDGGATAVTSGGGALFSEGAAGEAREDSLNEPKYQRAKQRAAHSMFNTGQSWEIWKYVAQFHFMQGI